MLLARGVNGYQVHICMQEDRISAAANITGAASQSWNWHPLQVLRINFSAPCVGAGSLSTLGVSRFCEKYPAVLATLQRSLLELVCKYQKQVLGYALSPQPTANARHVTSAEPARVWTVQRPSLSTAVLGRC